MGIGSVSGSVGDRDRCARFFLSFIFLKFMGLAEHLAQLAHSTLLPLIESRQAGAGGGASACVYVYVHVCSCVCKNV